MTLNDFELYIVVPAAATNEVTNPSSETNQTGKTASGAGVAIARSSTYQRRGVYSDEVTTASGVESGIYFGTVNEVLGESRTFSADVMSLAAGQGMRIQIRTTAGAVLSETQFTSSLYWQRPAVTRTGTANTTRRLYVVRDSVVSTAKFYVDGWYYGTVNGTYLDGDMKGFVRNQAHYGWNGTPHASTSWRSAQTRSGGTLLRIRDYARIMTVLGLGMASITNNAMAMPSDHSAYQSSRVNDREIVLNLAFYATGATAAPDTVQANRQAIINAVQPDRTAIRQPLVIRYQGLDSSGGDASEPLDIYAHYVDGLENLPETRNLQRAAVRFTAFLPFLSKAGDAAKVLGYNTSVSNFANVGYRDTDGQWKAMGTGATGGSVRALAVGLDGSVYAAGEFTGMGGIASTRGIAKWTGSAWVAVGTGANNNAVYALAIGPDGSLYAGGSFTQMGGVANTAYIAKWNGSAWSALGTGMNGAVFALVFGLDGTLYAGGAFTTAGGGAAAQIAQWNGAAWSALGTGGDTFAVNGLAVGKDGAIYAAGQFSTMGGVSGTRYIAKWSGGAWSAMGTAFEYGASHAGYSVAVGEDGMVYFGGALHELGLFRWNGAAWTEIITDNVTANALVNLNGTIYLGGADAIGGVPLPDKGAYLPNGGNTWLPLDVDVQDVSAIYYAFAMDQMGRLYLGGSWSGTTALSATVTASSAGGVRAYPTIKMTGPGSTWQIKNYTTGKTIHFNNFTLLAGETAMLTLMPGKVSFTSTFRGNLMPYIISGSDMDWYLLGGDNNVSGYLTGTTAASTLVMYWQDLYWSADGAKR